MSLFFLDVEGVCVPRLHRIRVSDTKETSQANCPAVPCPIPCRGHGLLAPLNRMKTVMKSPAHILLPLVIAALAALSACASPHPRMPPLAQIKGVDGRFKAGEILDLHQGESVNFETLAARIAPNDLVFVGEVHNQAEHHLIQVQILQALMACCGPVDLGMEFFRTPQQPVLDQYLAGEISEAEFLEAADWDDNWGFPYHFYRPLLAMARENGSRVLALNVPRDIVRKVARVGLEGLDPEERSRLPRQIDLTNEGHRDYVRDAYLLHDREGVPDFQFFYEAQCVYEEVMAQNLAAYFEQAGRNHRKMVVFAGNGHLTYRFGIPNRVLERIPVAAVTVLPYPMTGPVSVPGEIADFVWLTPLCSRIHAAMPPGRGRSSPETRTESPHDAP